MTDATSSIPHVFIASSVEGLVYANAIQQNLQHDAVCTVWNQGVFTPSSYPLESLEEELHKSDFGIFVFSPDDAIIMRDQGKKTVRDNVMIELGMSLGHLGRRRSFIVVPRDAHELHIPSDLTGLTPVTFNDSNKLAQLARVAWTGMFTDPRCNQKTWKASGR